MIFTTENFLKDNGDKIPADKKPAIEQALQQLKDAHKAQDLNAIDTATAALNTAVQAASAQMYGQAGPQAGAQGFQGGANAGAGSQQNNNGSDNKSDDNIQDADFEEVK